MAVNYRQIPHLRSATKQIVCGCSLTRERPITHGNEKRNHFCARQDHRKIPGLAAIVPKLLSILATLRIKPNAFRGSLAEEKPTHLAGHF